MKINVKKIYVHQLEDASSTVLKAFDEAYKKFGVPIEITNNGGKLYARRVEE